MFGTAVVTFSGLKQFRSAAENTEAQTPQVVVAKQNGRNQNFSHLPEVAFQNFTDGLHHSAMVLISRTRLARC